MALVELLQGRRNKDQAVLLLGTPSVFVAARTLGMAHECVLIDSNARIVESLRAVPEGGQFLVSDVFGGATPRITAGAVVVDCPWYPEEYRSFLWTASVCCTLEGDLWVVKPGDGTRPGIAREWWELMQWCEEGLGLEVDRIVTGSVRYQTPPFERNALRAIGFSSLPNDWRQADLVHIRKVGPVKAHRPVVARVERPWEEVVFSPTALRVRKGKRDDDGDPVMEPLVPNQVFPTVSRRDRRRAAVDVWTSGNRVYSSNHPTVVLIVARELANGGAVDSLARDGSQIRRSFPSVPAEALRRLAHQIREITTLERQELAQFGWH
jgi:hypothetical protein